MAMAGAAAGATATHLVEQQVCFNSFCDAIRLIKTCKDFNKDSFKKHRLYLSEAYVLMWHNTGTGDVDGRKSSLHLRSGAFAAVLVDLFALEKIDIIEDKSTLQCPEHQSLAIKVIDATPTSTYLDKAGFEHILAYHQKHDGRTKPVYEWLDREERECSVSVTLKNLVQRGILGDVHSGFFGLFHRYPTKDNSHEEELDKELKLVALKETKPDSYMYSLLTLSRTADNFFNFVDPILQKHFSKEEYKVAKENIKIIVQSQGAILRSPKLARKKFKT